METRVAANILIQSRYTVVVQHPDLQARSGTKMKIHKQMTLMKRSWSTMTW
jgi:hypothetical protein